MYAMFAKEATVPVSVIGIALIAKEFIQSEVPFSYFVVGSFFVLCFLAFLITIMHQNFHIPRITGNVSFPFYALAAACSFLFGSWVPGFTPIDMGTGSGVGAFALILSLAIAIGLHTYFASKFLWDRKRKVLPCFISLGVSLTSLVAIGFWGYFSQTHEKLAALGAFAAIVAPCIAVIVLWGYRHGNRK